MTKKRERDEDRADLACLDHDAPLPVEEIGRLNDLEHQLLSRMRADGFCSAEEVRSGILSEPQKVMLLDMVDLVKQRAVTPISEFHVGAVGVTEAGNLCAGVNLEFPGLPLSASVHAEQYLTVVSLQRSDRLHLIAVSAAPCGHCRQFFAETPQAEDLEFIFHGFTEPVSLDTILPHRFRPEDLQEASDMPQQRCAPLQGPFEFVLPSSGPGDSGLANTTASESTLQFIPEAVEKLEGLDAVWLRAAETARAAADRSHTFYTWSRAGVALVLRSGKIVRGFAIESAAYNPTLSPLHVALITLHSIGGSWADIVGAVLVEIAGAPVRYEVLVHDMLSSIAPRAEVYILQAVERT